MNDKIKRANSYVRSHIPHIVAAVSVVTTAGVIAFYESKTFLEVTPEHVRRLEQGGRYTYVALDHVFHLTLAKD